LILSDLDLNQTTTNRVDSMSLASVGICSESNLSLGAQTISVSSDDARPAIKERPLFSEFFAGSGLVGYALKPYFKAAWANDICVKKAAVYAANKGKKHFQLGSIVDVHGSTLPPSELSWASFPCQDLSLAGLTQGINGERSGLVWQWLRIMGEMERMPSVLVAENVTGLMSIDGGSQYRVLHHALRARGYTVGAVMLDAICWVPQSRPRVFVIAVKEGCSIPLELTSKEPNWLHPRALVKAAQGLDGWIWWSMPQPKPREINLADIVEWDAPCDAEHVASRNIAMIPPAHRERLSRVDITVAPGYKRTRSHKQVLELRFDGVAGCLRTPKGGSSRQALVLKRGTKLATRLLTVRETARLMGAPESFLLPGTYNDGYTAMGDAVAVPVARYLGKHLLAPLLKAK
jgi:DNA (cytosine-5)-methyltransferase 1